ncbi:MAG: ACT domain-containing protein [Coriobacteriales bacterium]|nr:ACT domain-containing protein [Coriobacteriales bacterium]
MGATLATELFAKLPARVGLLADVAGSLGSAGVNIVAIGAYEKEGQGEFYLMTSDNLRAGEILRGMGADVIEQSAVVVDVEDRPGALGEVTQTIAGAGINIDFVYATTSGIGREMIVFHTVDDSSVVSLLNAN